MKKNDLILAGSVILVAVLVFLLYAAFQQKGKDIRITVDGEEYGIYSLKEEQTIQINDTNVLEIKDGYGDMIDAKCPDKLCVHQRAINQSGESIICLPFKISVSVMGEEHAPYDAVAG